MSLSDYQSKIRNDLELLKSNCGESFPLGTIFVETILEQDGKTLADFMAMNDKTKEPWIIKSYDLIASMLFVRNC